MTELVVRRLLIDLNTPFAGRWNGGDAFRSAFFSALSMSFPVGEQYFMDSVRAGLKTLPPAERERFAPEVQGFVGQEATHRRKVAAGPWPAASIRSGSSPAAASIPTVP